MNTCRNVSPSIRLLLCMLLLCGCSSIRSSLVQRSECNSTWEVMQTRGIPITLKVPTHLQLVVTEVRYAYWTADSTEAQDADSAEADVANSERAPRKVARDGEWKLLESRPGSGEPLVTTDVQHHFISTEKIFTIDPKRPAAGDISFQLDLAEDQQYVRKFESDLTDRTIEETSMAFERLIRPLTPQGTGESLAESGTGDEGRLRRIESVKAVRVFEIDDPMFEMSMEHFLQTQFSP